jgi:hypothetical protein
MLEMSLTSALNLHETYIKIENEETRRRLSSAGTSTYSNSVALIVAVCIIILATLTIFIPCLGKRRLEKLKPRCGGLWENIKEYKSFALYNTAFFIF